MVKYVYDKHRLETGYEISSGTSKTSYIYDRWTSTFFRDYTIDNGVFVGVGATTIQLDSNTVNETIKTYPYYLDGDNQGENLMKVNQVANYTGGRVTFRLTGTSHTAVEKRVKGEFLEKVIAENGTYPTNGEHNGFWYVRKEIAQVVEALVNGQSRFVEKITCKVNGQAREVVGMWVKVNGELREV